MAGATPFQGRTRCSRCKARLRVCVGSVGSVRAPVRVHRTFISGDGFACMSPRCVHTKVLSHRMTKLRR